MKSPGEEEELSLLTLFIFKAHRPFAKLSAILVVVPLFAPVSWPQSLCSGPTDRRTVHVGHSGPGLVHAADSIFGRAQALLALLSPLVLEA